ncbi:MAG: polyribonucleotide nucleotidyltransferase [Bacillota bacterium]|nr:polyribonucleotide nucleotidyltransferase [Bacillota bacterium]
MDKRYQIDVAGRALSFEIGKLAGQANGSVLVRYGDTVVLVAATMSTAPRQGVDFFPLTVDYEERLYAVGKIPGGFIKREGRPSEKAILAARRTDRPLRVLFPNGMRNDVQIVCTILSVDHDASAEFCGMNGASLALSISDIPFGGPIGSVMIGRVDGQLVVNPVREQVEQSDLSLLVTGNRAGEISMVECGAREVPEAEIIAAMRLALDPIRQLIGLQDKIAAEIGKTKRDVPLFVPQEDVRASVTQFAGGRLKDVLFDTDKLRREAAVDELRQTAAQHLAETYPGREAEIGMAFEEIVQSAIRRSIVKGRRPDERRPDELRQVSAEVALLPRTHGSGLFTRGQTQVLTVATLGTLAEGQRLNDVGFEEFKRYMHHYNFPPYSTGETKVLRGPGRREIGHGALAEKALEPMIPLEMDFPYAIRLVSEVLESNGSSSMASVCGSALALMDAGVPIKAPVAGIAMGLVYEGEEYIVLTDIQGSEDHLGDMDFKVAGTAQGITALQLDLKLPGVAVEILAEAMEKARVVRLQILDVMTQALPAPRPEISPYAPRVIILHIDPEKIRDIIGPGGKTINKITAETGVKIDIEDDGRVYVAAMDDEAGQRAVKMIEDLTKDIEIGDSYLGRVSRIVNFGCFVEIGPGKEGLVRIGELAEERVAKVEDVVAVGDQIMVKVVEIDSQGRINLSRRQALRAGKGREERRDRS